MSREIGVLARTVKHPKLPIAPISATRPLLPCQQAWATLPQPKLPSKEISPHMPRSVQRIQTLNELRHYVNTTLCEHEQLEYGAFRFSERILMRGGRACGLYFCLHGPRAVRFSAIWETDSNTILFYSSTGERFHKTQLTAAPSLELMRA